MEFCAEDIERYKQEMRTYARRAGYSVDPPEADAPPPRPYPGFPSGGGSRRAGGGEPLRYFGHRDRRRGGGSPPEDSEADIKDEDG